MESAVKPEPFYDAKKFLEALRLTNEEWGWTRKDKPFENPKWFFRGQDNSDYKLMPRTWRKDNKLFIEYRDHIESNHTTFVDNRLYGFTNIKEFIEQKLRYLGPKKELSDDVKRLKIVLLQIATEIFLCYEFAQVADSIGAGIPGPKFDIMESLHRSYLMIKGERWQDNNWFNELTAVAQHHGVHTRLLDWTRDPLVAIHFAITTINSETLTKNPNQKIAVYAIKESFAEKDPMKTLKVPLSTSPYIHAQSGLFTYLVDGDKWFLKNGEWPSIEEYLSKSSVKEEVLRKLTLPITEVPKLAALLWMERKSRAHLMPTLDNVWQTLESDLLWQLHSKDNQ